MIVIGEKMGCLVFLLEMICDLMEKEIDNWLKVLVLIIEFLMIVLMGVIVGLIMVFIIGLIYLVIENIW